jgi:hypothetical protein
MAKVWKRGMALALGLCLGAVSLGGCSKKAAQAAPIYTMNGEAVDADLTNFLFRYQQSEFDTTYGQMFSQYYGGGNVWEMDLTGTGTAYGETFKSQFGSLLEHLLMAEAHADDYGVTLTEDEKSAISEAADAFLAANSEDVLKSMNATKETVERALTLYTIQSHVQDGMSADVDTEVSDEEAAQRKVSYIEYVPSTEAEEPETESELMAETEADAENTAADAAEALMTEAETAVQEAVQTEASDKTGSAETEDAAQAGSPETEEDTELEIVIEEESETEDPAMAAAREKYLAMAEAELEMLKSSGMDFAQAQTEASEGVTGVYASSLTFGADDPYTAAAIIEATEGLADNTLVDHIVEANGNYYILHVDLAFDREATDKEKESIVESRKNQKISEIYTEWEKDTDWTVDAAALAAVTYDRVYTAAPQLDLDDIIRSTEAETAGEGEAAGAAQTEAE